MVQVKIFGRIMDKKRQLVDYVPEHLFKDEIVVLTSMTVTGHACNGDDHPHPEQSPGISKNSFQFLFHTAMQIQYKKPIRTSLFPAFAKVYFFVYLYIFPMNN